ncbi:hypothetical protein MKZ24_16320 [Paenibacillus sp. FSL R7-0297]|uniref:hypothetical protein n=1 Tax=unclassified Paenibacillus TaxID=185978 RepID=UPI0004F5CFFE|nr:hypothetical protein [Paenibacillus sp. FSL R5-0912]AIQ42472.1 hypothetical protein R50912_22295 [Paenibacillus sp. FSL R5-0912]
MKILSIYFLFAALTLILITLVDVLSGTSVAESVHSLSVVFATTTLYEMICILIFLTLPLIQVIASAVKRSRTR